MSGLFGSTTIKGNRLTDFAGQTATVGIPIPFGYGRFPVDGNVIWTAGVPTEHVTKKKQGKGGVKTEEYTYTLSYAIAFCAGPIYGFLTIKRDGKVVYTNDPNAPADDLAFAAKWAQKATFYLGTREQLPDSTIEAKEGVGQVSAFRDLAYIVVEDDDVTAGGGAVPSYTAVVIATPPEVYMTSKPYPLLITDELSLDASIQKGVLHLTYDAEAARDDSRLGVTPISGALRDLQQAYAWSDPAGVGVIPVSGTLRDLQVVKQLPPEKASLGMAPINGTQKDILIKTSITPEPVSLGVVPLSGSLA